MLINSGSPSLSCWFAQAEHLPVFSAGRWGVGRGLHPIARLHFVHSRRLSRRKHNVYTSTLGKSCLTQIFFQVEIWLNRVLVHMKATVRHEMTEGVTAYEEKLREQWLFDYPAQVSPWHHLGGLSPSHRLSPSVTSPSLQSFQAHRLPGLHNQEGPQF